MDTGDGEHNQLIAFLGGGTTVGGQRANLCAGHENNYRHVCALFDIHGIGGYLPEL